MDFPITDLLDEQQSQQWLEQHFHPDGLHCPRCQASRKEAYLFRRTQSSRLAVYRCRECGQTYNLYTGTVFAHRQFTAPQVVLLLRGVFQAQSSSHLARELQMSRTTIHEVRQAIQHQAAEQAPQTPLPDAWTETDEMFQNAGEKRRATSGPR
jgi:transposase-like protein